MDPVSHAAFGASWAQSNIRGEKLVATGLVGAVAAMAPDLDELIRSSADPLLLLEYHRHFTHALAFVPFGALLCAGLFYRFARARLTFAETYLACLLGYGSHPLLDACTTYGTQLLWPFSDARIAWNIIAVIDPLFTVPVVALAALAAFTRRARYARFAAIWAVAYLALGAIQNFRAAAAGEELAASRNHVPLRLEAMPALGSLLLWKVVYEHDGRYYVDAVRTGLTSVAYPGENVAKLDLAMHF
ncbi:MAG TPA: metal-dependent hydrolase, partial [Gammaproteobacteria bacterium]|nr:metal-dependent hydrolase [Gammaproteobacteria bacterium]